MYARDVLRVNTRGLWLPTPEQSPNRTYAGSVLHSCGNRANQELAVRTLLIWLKPALVENLLCRK